MIYKVDILQLIDDLFFCLTKPHQYLISVQVMGQVDDKFIACLMRSDEKNIAGGVCIYLILTNMFTCSFDFCV